MYRDKNHHQHEILGRFTGERIADGQNINLNGINISAEELRSQQSGNQALKEYLDSIGRKIPHESDYNYNSGTKIYNISPCYFPGSYDFSKFKKSKKIGG